MENQEDIAVLVQSKNLSASHKYHNRKVLRASSTHEWKSTRPTQQKENHGVNRGTGKGREKRRNGMVCITRQLNPLAEGTADMPLHSDADAVLGSCWMESSYRFQQPQFESTAGGLFSKQTCCIDGGLKSSDDQLCDLRQVEGEFVRGSHVGHQRVMPFVHFE